MNMPDSLAPVGDIKRRTISHRSDNRIDAMQVAQSGESILQHSHNAALSPNRIASSDPINLSGEWCDPNDEWIEAAVEHNKHDLSITEDCVTSTRSGGVPVSDVPTSNSPTCDVTKHERVAEELARLRMNGMVRHSDDLNTPNHCRSYDDEVATAVAELKSLAKKHSWKSQSSDTTGRIAGRGLAKEEPILQHDRREECMRGREINKLALQAEMTNLEQLYERTFGKHIDEKR
eukprot:SAG31_NODE_25_length_33055_cov_11.407919_11_plen_233_part_00